MIVITGATGELGRHIVKNLLKRLPTAQIGISVRDPQKAEDLKQRGIRVCKGDFAEPASLLQAFDGAEQLLMVSVNKFGEEAVRQHANAIRAAKNAGVKRILYTSHQGANPSSAFAPGRDHGDRSAAPIVWRSLCVVAEWLLRGISAVSVSRGKADGKDRASRRRTGLVDRPR